MKTVTMLEFRRNALEIIRRTQRGQRILLTYRGKPVARLEPIHADRVREDDPIYGLPELADSDAGSLSNRDIDGFVYGE